MDEEKIYRVEVTPSPRYIPDQSEPDDGNYVFAYTIAIRNTGTVPVQLIPRHWIIGDAGGEVQEVRGLGAIGQQPVLQPGEVFEYTNGCTLKTPVGTMKGSYRLMAADGTSFDAEIPEFTLAMPRVLH